MKKQDELGSSLLEPNSDDYSPSETGEPPVPEHTGQGIATTKPKQSEGELEGVPGGKQLMELLEKQDYCCRLTGRKLTPESASIEHLQPISQGGTDSLENLAWVEWAVNKAKGEMTLDEFVSMCRDVVHRFGS